MMKLSYYLAPEEALDNPDNMKIWAEKGFAAALRAPKKGKKAKAKK
jgi:TfoX/Sxy family transcriptional regulator of competence genes